MNLKRAKTFRRYRKKKWFQKCKIASSFNRECASLAGVFQTGKQMKGKYHGIFPVCQTPYCRWKVTRRMCVVNIVDARAGGTAGSNQ